MHSSKPIPQCTAVGADGGGLLTEESELKARWASDVKRLYQTDQPAFELDIRGVTIPIADPPMNCDPPLFLETLAVANWLRWDIAPGICGIHAQLLNAGRSEERLPSRLQL